VVCCAMHLYGQYCPVARAAEILADRWTLLIVRELLADVDHFNELQRGLPGISRSLLADRLRLLVSAGVAERRTAEPGRRVEYRLTPAGRDLQKVIEVLGDWGAHWAFGDPRPNELDPIVLLWWMRRRVCLDRLTKRRVLQFEFQGLPRTYWLLLQPAEASVCLQHPGFEIDLLLHGDIAVFYRVWLGRLTLSGAMNTGHLRIEGSPSDVRRFPHWFAWSPMAERVRAASTSQQVAAADL
jgi:DNA-binding HxlR family transcriptional regulator